MSNATKNILGAASESVATIRELTLAELGAVSGGHATTFPPYIPGPAPTFPNPPTDSGH